LEGLVEAKASGIECTKYGEDKCVIGSMSPNTLSTKFLLDPIRLDLNGRGHQWTLGPTVLKTDFGAKDKIVLYPVDSVLCSPISTDGLLQKLLKTFAS
jgi:hypothetical protein